MPRRLLLVPITRRLITFELREKTDATITLARNNDTNGFEPPRTWPCAARYSAAPTADYYLAINQTLWLIHGPRAGYLLHNQLLKSGIGFQMRMSVKGRSSMIDWRTTVKEWNSFGCVLLIGNVSLPKPHSGRCHGLIKFPACSRLRDCSDILLTYTHNALAVYGIFPYNPWILAEEDVTRSQE